MFIPKTMSIAAFQNGDMGTPNYVFNFFDKRVCFFAAGIDSENGVETWGK